MSNFDSILVSSVEKSIDISTVTGKLKTSGIVLWKILKNRYLYCNKKYLVTGDSEDFEKIQKLNNLMNSVKNLYPEVCNLK